MVCNQLADPFILGISSGASVGAATVVALGAFSALGMWALSAAVFLGALTSAALVFTLAGGHKSLSPNRLILTGGSSPSASRL
ncbi:iron chelate uptake ABC transporter family permease subunit [Corynebacterium mastitidis]|uniref:iron chelate uptake ABC transporter family permease subunit n=1 Tax=Corynebacterium mastitidis TaxID=161890 RepID=UPI003D7504EB